MKWLGKLTRWRSNHGYGVHSPFAFRFITAVVRQTSYFYYAYPALDAAAGRKDRREARLLFRILCHFNPGNVVLSGNIPRWVHEAVTLADSRTHVLSPDKVTHAIDNPFFIIGAIDSNDIESVAGTITRHIGSGMTAVVRDPSHNQAIVDKIASAVTHGMIFRGDQSAIIVTRHDLPRQEYRITL